MKRNILFLTIALSIICLSACGDKNKPEETKPTLEVIQPTETEAETLSDKLDETKTLTIEPAQEPRGIGVDENGNIIVETNSSIEESSADENNAEASTEISDTDNTENETSEVETLTPEEESQMAEENNAKLKEIQESAAESLAAEEETLSADDYQQIDNAIDEYTKKEAEEWFKDMPAYE